MRASQRQSNGFKEKVFDHGRRLWSNKFRLKELHIGRRREIAAERKRNFTRARIRPLFPLIVLALNLG